jgi:glutathione peroxidase
MTIATFNANAADLLDQDFRVLAGDDVVNLGASYSGKVILVVNTASMLCWTCPPG